MHQLLSGLAFLLVSLSWTLPAVHAQQSDPCASLHPGDVMIYAFNSDPPESVNMVALAQLHAGLVLFITDNAWTGTEFLTNEGTYQLTLTSDVQPGGSLGYSQNADDVPYSTDWVNVEDDNPKGQFALSDTGDSILVYCNTTSGGINHLDALSYTTGGFADPGLSPDEYGTRNTALPAPLKDVGSVALPHLDDYRYTGPTSGNKTELQSWLGDWHQYTGYYNPDDGAPAVVAFDILTEGSAADLAKNSDGGGGGGSGGGSGGGGGKTSLAMSLDPSISAAAVGALVAFCVAI